MPNRLPVYQSKEAAFFRRQHNSTICFVIAMLLFFLPFAEFRCGKMAILANSGVGIATGQDWKVASSWNRNEIMEKLGDSKKEGNKLMKDNPNIFAIAALVAGLFGIGIAFSPLSWRSTAGMCAGILASIMMIAMMIQFKIEMRSAMGKQSGDADALGLDMGGIVKIQFTIWYYFSLVLFIMAAFLNYMRDKIALREAMAAAVDFDFQRKDTP